jgi:hypothetical protein
VAWKLTVRHGSQVDRASFSSLEEALAEARGRAAAVLSEGGLGTVKAFRDYEPGDRVNARIEISGGGFLRGPEAGIDVMGDGAIVPYSGGIRKQRLAEGSLDESIERVRRALTGD